MRLSLSAITLLALLACEQKKTREIELHIVTNAPVEGSGALFHRVRVTLLPPGETVACSSCSRTFNIDKNEVTLSLVPERTQTGYRAEVALYRKQANDIARAESTITRRVALPPLPAETAIPVTISLDIRNVGKPIDDEVGVPLEPWIHNVPCVTTVSESEACVPGGAFWMGNAETTTGHIPNDDGNHERVVVIAPFIIDTTEVTDAEYRRLGGQPRGVKDGQCQLTPPWLPPPSNGEVPVTCTTWAEAREHCEKRSARLPTEAELEYLQGGLRSQRFPWGDDPPTCADMLFGTGLGDCAGASGASPVGKYPRDSLQIGDRSVFDLVGNVSEFAEDRYEMSGGACWPSGVLHNPMCAWTNTSDAFSARGGSYAQSGRAIRSSYRFYVENGLRAVADTVGFRCARTVK